MARSLMETSRLSKKTTERATTSEKAEEKKDEDRPSEDIDYSGAYPCPQEGCIRVFQNLSNLKRHLSVEKCSRSLERLSLLDLAKTEYAAVLQEGVSTMPTLEPTSTLSLASASPKEGWALKESRKAYRFNEKQRSYLEAKFNLGQSTGRKVDPDFVAKEMRRALDSDGKRLFRPSEFLTVQQITSFFARLAAKLRHQVVATEDDICAVEEEANFQTAIQEILSEIEVEHPIVFDQYNLCALVVNNSLKNLKMGLLETLCEKLELEVSTQSGRRKKAPYIAALSDLVAGCSCGGRS